MDAVDLLERVQSLTDLEHAVLVTLMAGEHCIIESEANALSSVEAELKLIASNVLGLSYAALQCSQSMTLEDLSNGILIETGETKVTTDFLGQGPYDITKSSSREDSSSPLGTRNQDLSIKSTGVGEDQHLANVIVLRDLDLASSRIQIQVLELIRTRRAFSHKAVHAAPKQFIVIVLKSSMSLQLHKFLNDHLFLSHYHDPDDGYANLEEGSDWIEDDRASTNSVVHRTVRAAEFRLAGVLFGDVDLLKLVELRKKVSISAEVEEYMHNVVTFLRLHRAVSGGVTPRATKALGLLVKCLASLHGLGFVAPSFVALAARKIYYHRLEMVSAQNERSMQYGSDLGAVAALLQAFVPESVVEEVLDRVDAPL